MKSCSTKKIIAKDPGSSTSKPDAQSEMASFKPFALAGSE